MLGGVGPLLERLRAVDVDENAGEGARESSRKGAEIGRVVEVDVGAVGESLECGGVVYSSTFILRVLCSFVFRIVDKGAAEASFENIATRSYRRE